MLKRKFEETVGEGDGADNAMTTSNGQSESDDSNCSAGSTDALAPEVASGPSPPKRLKKKVNFKGVTVYYFPRRQGFTCVPSEGGSTLGMTERHSFTKDFSLSDYSKEQKRIHRAILAEQRRQGKMFPSPLLASSMHMPDNDDDISSGSESDSEYDDYYFLQPLPIRQRRVLLRTAGVKKIDNEEKDECRDIRVSRNVCGCDCKVFCDPATCSCSAAGIQCQVDRLSFPCGCTKDGCANPAGRIEFNPIRVRTHFIHTLMRLELERKDSESPESSSSAATTSFLQSSPGNLDIDVVGANGEEAEAVAEALDLASGDSCSGASTDSSSSSGKLKSKLKLKKAEAIDLNLFNSNEKGSCRDCQNTDMCNVMMHDVKFSMASQQRQQQQQQQRSITVTLGAPPGYQGAQNQQTVQQHHLGLSPGISLLRPPVSPQPSQPSGTHMLLFNDGEEDVYQAENTTSMYFDNDDSSYSELSDTSPEGLEARPFAVLNQNSFNGKFHLFNPITSNSSVPTKAQTLMPNGSSVMSPAGLHPISASCTLGADHQQPCGLFTPSSSAPHSGQSLLRTPYQQPSCIGPPPSSINSAALIPRPPIPTGLGLEMAESSHMLQGSLPAFPGKFPHSDDLNGHMTSASFKLDSSLIPVQSYGSDPGPPVGYLSTSNIPAPNPGTFANLASPAAVNSNTAGFETLQGGPCWTTSLVSSSLRECYGPSVPPTTGSGHEEHTLCKPNFQLDVIESCALSPTTTYATMTTTTRDLLAAHCPGISSHMDSKLELSTSSSIKDSETYPTFHVPSQSADSGDIIFTSPYPDRGVMDPSGTATSLCPVEELDRKACNLSEDLFANDCIDSAKQPSRLLSPDLASSEISSKLLPLTSQFVPAISTLLPASCGLLSSPDHRTTSPADVLCAPECSTVSQRGIDAHTVFYDCAASATLEAPDTQQGTCSLVEPTGDASCDFDSPKRPGKDALTKWDCQESSAVRMSVEIPGEVPELEAATSSSSAPSSSSSSPNTSEEEKDSNVRPSFGDIMKDSLVEMVLV